MLSGERVVLRPFRPEDVEPLWRAKLEPLKWAQTTADPLQPITLEAHKARYAELPKDTSAQFAVDVDGGLIGRALLFHVDDLARNAEVGIALLPEHQGRGHGKDVLRVLLDYGFRSRNLHRIHLQTLSSNEAGLRAYRAVGFVEEGRLREHAWVEGAYEDMVLMSVLRSEWSPRTAGAQTSKPSR